MFLLLFFSLFVFAGAFDLDSVLGKSDWDSFKDTFDKKYSTRAEAKFRHEIFLENKKLIDGHNKLYTGGLVSFSLEINQYADLSPDEFRMMLGTVVPPEDDQNTSTTYLNRADDQVPEAIDWRQKGYVTDVKNQGSCGSCWAFTANGAVEGQTFRKTGKLVSLSAQNLVDCTDKNSGCGGGVIQYAFQYIKDNKGVDTDSSYLYEEKKGNCRFKTSDVAATVSGYVNLPQKDELALKKAVGKVGPVAVAIDAGRRSFQFYSQGVYYDSECSSDQLNHGVLAVGYGNDQSGGDYWIIKNSWGSDWGEKGYVRMARNRQNNCGVATSTSYPLV